MKPLAGSDTTKMPTARPRRRAARRRRQFVVAQRRLVAESLLRLPDAGVRGRPLR
jgi:hypothetical protein